MDNRRRFSRFDIDVPAVIECVRVEGEKTVQVCWTVNLSAAGAFIRSSQPLPEGTPVKMDFVLQFADLETSTNPRGDLKLSASGHVLRSEPEGMAIRFSEDCEIYLREEKDSD